MASDVLVSVCCITYNHEKYIESALEGFVKQKTDFPFEVIVHDDASTDRTSEIIRQYEKKYPTIIKAIYQTENQYSKGVSISNIYADWILPRAGGRYIALCEGDDFWIDEYKLQKQFDFMERHPDYSACFHNSVLFKVQQEKTFTLNEFPYGMFPYDMDLVSLVEKWGNEVHTSSCFCRRAVAESFFLEPRPEFSQIIEEFVDFPMTIWLVLNGKVRYLPDVMSVYRVGTSGSWTEQRDKHNDKHIKSEQKVIAMLESVDQYTDYRYHKGLGGSSG